MEVITVVQDLQRGSFTALECNNRALFAGTSSGFLLRFPCTSFDLSRQFGSTASSQDRERDTNEFSERSKLSLQVERSVGEGLLPLTSVKCCPREEIVAAICRSSVYLFRESDLHPLHAIGSQPFVTSAISITFNARSRGVCDSNASSFDAAYPLPLSDSIPVSALCIEHCKELLFFKIPTRSLDNIPGVNTKTPRPYSRLPVDPDLKALLWVGESVVMVYSGKVIFRSLSTMSEPRIVPLGLGARSSLDGACDVAVSSASRAILMGSNEIVVLSQSSAWKLKLDGLGSAKAHDFGKACDFQLHGCCPTCDGIFLLVAPTPQSSTGPLHPSGGRTNKISGFVERTRGWEMCWSATIEGRQAPFRAAHMLPVSRPALTKIVWLPGGRHLVGHGSQTVAFCSVGQSIVALVPSLDLPKAREASIRTRMPPASDNTGLKNALSFDTSISTPKLPRRDRRVKMRQTVSDLICCDRDLVRVASDGIQQSETIHVNNNISGIETQQPVENSTSESCMQSTLNLLHQSGGECVPPRTENMFAAQHLFKSGYGYPKRPRNLSTWQVEIFLRSNGRSMDWTGDWLQASGNLVCSLCLVRGQGLERVSTIENIRLDPCAMSKNGCLVLKVCMTVHGSAEDRRQLQLAVRTGRTVTEFLPVTVSASAAAPRCSPRLGDGLRGKGFFATKRSAQLNDSARQKNGGLEEVQYVEPCTYSIVRIFTTSGLGVNTKSLAPSPIHVRPSSSSGEPRDFRTWEIRGSDVGVHVHVSQIECLEGISIYDQEAGVILADHCELPWLGSLKYMVSTDSPTAPVTAVCEKEAAPSGKGLESLSASSRQSAACCTASLSRANERPQGSHPVLALSPLSVFSNAGGKVFLVTATILCPGSEVTAHTFTLTSNSRPSFLQDEVLFPLPGGLRPGARLHFSFAYVKHRTSLLRGMGTSRNGKEIVSFGHASFVLHDGMTSTADGRHTVVIESPTNSKGHTGRQSLGSMQIFSRFSGVRLLQETSDTAIANFREAYGTLKQAWREQNQEPCETEQAICYAIASAASLKTADPVQLRKFCSELAELIWGIASVVCVETLSGSHQALSLCSSLLHVIVVSERLFFALGAPTIPHDRSLTESDPGDEARKSPRCNPVQRLSSDRMKNATEVITTGFRLLLSRGGGQWWWPGTAHLFQLLSRNGIQNSQPTVTTKYLSGSGLARAETLKQLIRCLQPAEIVVGRSESREDLNRSITDCILSFCVQSCHEGSRTQALDVVDAYLSTINWSEWRVQCLRQLALSPCWCILNGTDSVPVVSKSAQPTSALFKLEKSGLASRLIEEAVSECSAALRHSQSEHLVPSSACVNVTPSPAVAALCEVLQYKQECGTRPGSEETLAMYLQLVTWCVDHKVELEDAEFEQSGGSCRHKRTVRGVATCFISLVSDLTPMVSRRAGHLAWGRLVEEGYSMSDILDTVRVCLQIILRQACEHGVSGTISIRESKVAREWWLHPDKTDGLQGKEAAKGCTEFSSLTQDQIRVAEGALELWVGRPSNRVGPEVNKCSVLQKALGTLRKHWQMQARKRCVIMLNSSIQVTMLIIERFTRAPLQCPAEQTPPHGLIQAGWESVIRIFCTALDACPSAQCCIEVIAVTLRCLQHSSTCLRTAFSNKHSDSESTCTSSDDNESTTSGQASVPMRESEHVGQGLGVELVLVVLKRMSHPDKRVRDGAVLVLLAMLKGAVEMEGNWERLEGAFGAALAEAVEVLDREESLMLSQSLEAAAEILTCNAPCGGSHPSLQKRTLRTPLDIGVTKRKADQHRLGRTGTLPHVSGFQSEQCFNCTADLVPEDEVDRNDKVVGWDGLGVTLSLRPRATAEGMQFCERPDLQQKIVTGAHTGLHGTVWSSSVEGCNEPECWCEEMTAVSRFVSESKEFVKRHLIFRTIEKEDANYDVVADAMSGIIEVMWLWKLLRFHRSKGGDIEAAQCAQELSEVVEREVMAMKEARRIQVGLLVGSTGNERESGLAMTASLPQRKKGAPRRAGSALLGPTGFDGTVDLGRIGMDTLEVSRARKAEQGSRPDRVGAELFAWKRLAQCYREEAKLMAVAGRVEGAYAAERRLITLLDQKGGWDGIEKAHIRAANLARLCKEQAGLPPGAASSMRMYLVRYEGPAFDAREGMEYVYLAPQFCQVGEFAEQLAVQAQGLLALPPESLHSTRDSRYLDASELPIADDKGISVEVLIGSAPAKAGGKAFLRVQALAVVQKWHRDEGHGKGSSAKKPFATDQFFYDLPALASGEVGRSVLLREQWKLRTTVRVRNSFPFRTRRQLVLEKSSVLVHPMLGASEALTERAVDVVAACSMKGEGKTKELERLLVGTLIVQVNAGPLALIETFSAPPGPSNQSEDDATTSALRQGDAQPQPSQKTMSGLRRKFLDCVEEFTSTCELAVKVYADGGGGGLLLEELQIGMQRLRRASAEAKRGLRKQETRLQQKPRSIVRHLEKFSASEEGSGDDEDSDTEEEAQAESLEHVDSEEHEMLVLSGSGCWT